MSFNNIIPAWALSDNPEDWWIHSMELQTARALWKKRMRVMNWDEGAQREFELSSEFRNARAAYRRRINGKTKADH